MRQALLLTSLATLAAVSFGCALTDYPSMGVHNKSHGVINCTTDDRMANTQQTLEPQTRDLLYTSSFGGPNDAAGNCLTPAPSFNPRVTLNNVNHEDARDWNRFIADWVFLGEAQVFSPPAQAGTYALAAVKDLPDGARRINNYYSPGVGNFTCVGAAVDGRYGGPEGVVVSDGLTGRIPGLRLDSIAVDSAPGLEWCANIAAVSDDRAANGFSTYWAFTGRSAEGRLPFTPITRREGLAQFMSGDQMSATLEGVTATASGSLRADGSLEITLVGLSHAGVTYTADTAIKLTVDPSNNFRSWGVNATEAELVRLADFALQAGLTDTVFTLGGKQVPEFGLTLPPVAFSISGSTLRSYIAGELPGNDGTPGFGG